MACCVCHSERLGRTWSHMHACEGRRRRRASFAAQDGTWRPAYKRRRISGPPRLGCTANRVQFTITDTLLHVTQVVQRELCPHVRHPAAATPTCRAAAATACDGQRSPGGQPWLCYGRASGASRLGCACAGGARPHVCVKRAQSSWPNIRLPYGMRRVAELVPQPIEAFMPACHIFLCPCWQTPIDCVRLRKEKRSSIERSCACNPAWQHATELRCSTTRTLCLMRASCPERTSRISKRLANKPSEATSERARQRASE